MNKKTKALLTTSLILNNLLLFNFIIENAKGLEYNIVSESVRPPIAEASSIEETVEGYDGDGILVNDFVTKSDLDKTAQFSAYTSRPEETDDSPCVGADNTNLCEYDGCAVASNDYPLGTQLEIKGFGVCTVKDRMNRRYTGTGNIDIYFKHDLAGARKFGRQNLRYKVL